MNPTPGFRKLMIVMASIICLIYLTYRAFFTFNLTTPYAVFASVFLYVGELFGIINLLLYFLQVWDVSETPAKPVLEGRSVDVFVPTYNEDPQLLRATLEACARMDYPHRTYVLDDGRRPEVKALADELGIGYITRPDNRNAKAGNLNFAFEQTDGEFIVVLDADHVPEPHFITRLVGYFADPKLAYVQTPHAFYNFDSFQARLDPAGKKYWEEGHLFYCVIQPGRNHWNSSIFAGSATMFRRNALKDIGYIAVETITEDMHTGLRLHAKGWKSIAISERLVAGQAAPDITTFHSQRLRWGEGNLSIMAYDNPLTMKGLTLAQRLSYFGSMITWASGLFKLSIYMTPILMLFTGVPPVREFDWTLGIVTLTYLIFSLFTLKVVSNGYGSILNSELFAMVNFWTQVRSTFRAIFRRKNQRFVVTSKRGRQSKQIWTFIRPQTYLIILSVLALIWGWGRLVLKISDDYFRPMIPTIWVLIHMVLAYMVIRRALWPINRRFSIRHDINLPVEYELTTAASKGPRFGVTVDLNETGMAFIAYEKFEPGTVMRFTIRGAGEIVKCRGEVRSGQTLTNEAGFPGFRYGILFKNLTSPQIDALNRMCLHYAVPKLYEQYNRGNRDNSIRRFVNWRDRGMSQRRRDARFQYHLPIILNSGSTEESLQYTSTEDLSRVSTAVLIDQELSPNTPVSFLMPTPLGDVRGLGKVIRSERRQYAGQVYHRCIFEFTDFDGQGRNIVQSLANPDQQELMTSVLRPAKNLPKVKMLGPILVGLAILVPLVVALRFGVFRFVHDDDLWLRQFIDQETVMVTEQEQKLTRIYEGTKNDTFPSTDRLVLLMEALRKANRNKPELEEITKKLGVRDMSNWDLRAALAQAYDNTFEREKAEEEYQVLLSQAERGVYTKEGKVRELYVAAGHCAVHNNDNAKAADRFDRALKLPGTTNPPKGLSDDDIRYFLASSLANQGKYKEAERVYQDVSEPPLEGQKLLVGINIAKGDYRNAQALASEIERKNPIEGKQLSGEIAQANKQFEMAREIFTKLVKDNPDNQDLKVKLAQTSLASSMWNDSLNLFSDLYRNGTSDPQVIQGYVDAASSAKELKDPHPENLRKIADTILQEPLDEMQKRKTDKNRAGFETFLARLSWGLEKAGDMTRSRDVIERAYGLKPSDPTIRGQYAGLLIRTKDFDRATDVLGGEGTKQASKLRVVMYMTNKNYDAAIRVAEETLRSDETDLEGQELYVDALCLKGDFDAAIKHLDVIRKKVEKNEDRRKIAIKQARTLIWSGSKIPSNFAIASSRIQQLIEQEDDFEKSEPLWDDFIAATAAANSIEPGQLKLVEKIAETYPNSAKNDPLIYTRLAYVLLKNNGNKALAKPLLDQAIAINPREPEIRFEMAGVLAQAGRQPEAARIIESLPPETLTTERSLALAQIYSGNQDFQKALETVSKTLAKDGKNKQARYLQAELLSWNKQYPEAIRQFEQLAKDFPEDNKPMIRLAQMSLWSKNYEVALDRFERLLDKAPENQEVWQGFSQSISKVDRPIKPSEQRYADLIFERMAITPSRDAVVLASVGWMASKLGETTRSDELIKKALEVRVTDPEKRREMSNIMFETRRYNESLTYLEGVEPNLIDRYRLIDLGVVLRNSDLLNSQAEIILKTDPADSRARGARAFSLGLQRRYMEALGIYESLLNEKPNDLDLFRQVSDALLGLENYSEAMRRYQVLLEKEIEKSELWLLFIDSCSSAPDFRAPNMPPESVVRMLNTIYDRMLAVEIKDPARYSRLAWSMYNLNEFTRANRAIDRAIAQNPTNPETRVEIAGVLSALNRNTESLAMFDGTEIGRLAPIYRKLYADQLVANRQFARAEQELRSLMNLNPTPEQALEYRKLLATLKTRNQQFKEALTMWTELETKYPKDIDVQLNLATVSMLNKDYTNAISRFNSVLKSNPDRPEVWNGYLETIAALDVRNPEHLSLLRSPAVRSSVHSLYERLMAAETSNLQRANSLASLGSALAKLGDPVRCKQVFNRAVTMTPNAKNIWVRYGESLYALEDYDPAERIFAALANGRQPQTPPIRR
jgi:cellulose synthase/poly-beta-1,6-N-acetylglucosamine synthase-like glycosyltransferase/tetratricopeptide (TPR) repeat protein